MGILDSLFGGGQQGAAGIAGFQKPFLTPLFEQSLALQQQLQGQFQGLGGIAQGLGQQGQGFINQLGQAGQGLNQFIGQGTTDQQIAGVQGVAQNFLNQNLNQISGTSNLAGQFGGGRQSTAEGAAIGQASAGLGGVTSQILAQDIARRQQAAGLQGTQQLAGAQAQLGGLGNLFGLAQGGLAGQFGGLGLLAGLIGPPVNLAGGGSTQGGILPGLGDFFSGLSDLESSFG